MQRYMYEYDVPLDAFAGFSINAHRNGANNPNAMFQEAITLEEYVRAPVIATPINMMDSSPVCDGSAALVLVPTEMASQFTTGHHRGAVQILASASANDTLAVHDRKDPLFLEAAYLSSQKALRQAGIQPADLDLFELHDAFTIMSALSLEATGFARRGEGWRMAHDGEIAIDGRLPISTMGGLKSRGHPVGATGVYQIVELVQQLTGTGRRQSGAGCTAGDGPEHRRQRRDHRDPHSGQLKAAPSLLLADGWRRPRCFRMAPGTFFVLCELSFCLSKPIKPAFLLGQIGIESANLLCWRTYDFEELCRQSRTCVGVIEI